MTYVPSLRTLIRSIAVESSDDDPQKLAQEVFNGISPDDYGMYLSQALPVLVSRVLMDMRSQKSLWEDNDTDDAHTHTSTPTVSRRVGNVRAHAAFLSGRYKGANGWIMVADMTAEDCGFVASDLFRQAEAFRSKAEVFSQLLTHMVFHGATRVSELDDSVITQALNYDA